jgi:FkbM family methyltransferase
MLRAGAPCSIARSILLLACQHALLLSAAQSKTLQRYNLGDGGSRGAVSLGSFNVPDYDIHVEITTTQPPYYCVTFTGRKEVTNGTSEEGCASIGQQGQDMFRTLVGLSAGSPLVVDVGANVGSHSSFPAALGARVIAIEPDAYHARRLYHMAHLNDWNMRVFSGGADDHDGESNINVLQSGCLAMRDPETVDEPDQFVQERRPIQVTTLDSLLWEEPEQMQVLFLKIDTDGHELQVLKGARKWMEEGPGVKYIKFEFCPYGAEVGNNGNPGTALELLQLMRHWNFSLYNIWEGGEFFCAHNLEPQPPEADEALIQRLRQIAQYAQINMLAVNGSHVADLALDFNTCLPPPGHRDQSD